jgi:hypothetical protein
MVEDVMGLPSGLEDQRARSGAGGVRTQRTQRRHPFSWFVILNSCPFEQFADEWFLRSWRPFAAISHFRFPLLNFEPAFRGETADFREVGSKRAGQDVDGNPVSWEMAAMRLDDNVAAAVREEIYRFDPAAEIYLYGSRADDAARGGDIDLLVISDQLGFRDVLRLRTRILDRIGWQQLDLLVRRPNQLTDPMLALALETGIRL